MELKNINNYWADELGNKWDISKFNKKQAKNNANSLKFCSDCTDCSNCNYCAACSDCYQCHDCVLCGNCNNCMFCNMCDDCSNCENCLSCRNYNSNPQRIYSPIYEIVNLGFCNANDQLIVMWTNNNDIQVIRGEGYSIDQFKSYYKNNENYMKFIDKCLNFILDNGYKS